jgi:hypothetical protein
MPASFINDPEQWRQRAEEARSIADQMNEPQSKEAMLRIAKPKEPNSEPRVRADRDRPGSADSGRTKVA